MFGEYFDKCETKFVTMFPKVVELQQIEDLFFYGVMARALTDEQPAAFYQNSDWPTRLTFGLIGVLPSDLADWARLALMRLPEFKK